MVTSRNTGIKDAVGGNKISAHLLDDVHTAPIDLHELLRTPRAHDGSHDAEHGGRGPKAGRRVGEREDIHVRVHDAVSKRRAADLVEPDRRGARDALHGKVGHFAHELGQARERCNVDLCAGLLLEHGVGYGQVDVCLAMF